MDSGLFLLKYKYVYITAGLVYILVEEILIHAKFEFY